MKQAEEFRPFFFSEYGWLVIIPSALLLLHAFRRAGPDLRARLLPSAPFRLLLGIIVISGGAGIVAGVGLLLESRAIAVIGALVAAAAMVVGFVIANVYRKRDAPEPPSA